MLVESNRACPTVSKSDQLRASEAPISERMSGPTAIERAFELARSGNYAGSGEIRRALKAEGYMLDQLNGSQSLVNQLRRLCTEARRASKRAGAVG